MPPRRSGIYSEFMLKLSAKLTDALRHSALRCFLAAVVDVHFDFVGLGVVGDLDCVARIN